MEDRKDVTGEGNYSASRRYRQDVEKFAQSEDTEALARDAAPQTDEEQEDLAEAEREGLRHSKGEDEADVMSDESPSPYADSRGPRGDTFGPKAGNE